MDISHLQFALKLLYVSFNNTLTLQYFESKIKLSRYYINTNRPRVYIKNKRPKTVKLYYIKCNKTVTSSNERVKKIHISMQMQGAREPQINKDFTLTQGAIFHLAAETLMMKDYNL